MTTEELERKLDNLPNKIIDEVVLLRLSSGVIAIIRKRTLDGKYLEGSSPGAEQYSVTPLPLPFAKFQANVKAKLTKEQAQNKDKYVLFTAKSGNTWIIVQGGYKEFRKLAGKFSDHVVMSWTGRLMRNLGLIRKDDSGADVGFPDTDAERIARYHNIEGAGKSRRKHVFFDLSKEERERLTKLAGETISKNLLKVLS
ncbi:MAG: hypothetical protein EPO24_07730 [Bacteroidetes bacterium]|nr:MAG: hypothetical protein EPO24_07730 [Bacteroidota bacterium]